MEFRQCFQCKNDLPNTTGPEVVPCLFCGAINEAPPSFEVKYVAKPLRKNRSHTDSSYLYNSNNCNSDGGSGDCGGG